LGLPGLWTELPRPARGEERFPNLPRSAWILGRRLRAGERRGSDGVSHARYRDARTHGRQGCSGWPQRAALERVYAATGIANVFYNSSLQLRKPCALPAVADVASLPVLPDYFNYLLSGRMENEISFASTTQLLDVHGTDWSRATLDHFHIPRRGSRRHPRQHRARTVRNFPELAGVTVVACRARHRLRLRRMPPIRRAATCTSARARGRWSASRATGRSSVRGAYRTHFQRGTGDGRYRP